MFLAATRCDVTFQFKWWAPVLQVRRIPEIGGCLLVPMNREGKETVLQESDRLRLLVTGVSTYAIYLVELDGTVVTWNPGAQRLKGYAAEEIVGRNFEIFYTKEDRRAGTPWRELRVASEEGTFEVETWRVRSDGSLFWGSVVIDAIRDVDGRPVSFVSITRDITDRQLAAQALRTGEERYRTLLEGVADYAIYMLCKQGDVTSWNGGAARIIGYPADEILGSHFARFFTESDRDVDIPMATLHAAALEGRYEGEGWRVRANDSRFWAHTVVEPVRNPAGHLLGFSVVTRDITEKRESALALERAREHLFQAQKLDALGKVTSGVAHDFNNLLGIIQSAAVLLSREALSEQGTKVLASLRRAADSGAGLTRELLLFARHQPLQDEEHDLNALVRSFEPVLRQLVRGRINFELRLDAMPTVVRIDATQFEAALLNLVSNAFDAMPEGGLLILSIEDVELTEGQIGSLAPGRFARVAVKDTGTGMAADIATRAIEPFFTTKEPGHGTGMGLGQVLGLVQRVGGEMVLDTAQGNGTTVSLYLPLMRSEGDIMTTGGAGPLTLTPNLGGST
jgi:PAS domain S-box-containing protein